MAHSAHNAHNDRQARGFDVLHDARLNKSTAFSEEERDQLGLRGLLPPAVCTQEVQVERAVENMRRKAHDIERFIFLQALEARNERLFFRLAMDHIEEVMPLIYTPTVGQACQEFAHIFRQPKGLYVTDRDRGHVRDILRNWPATDVSVAVVSDGERILGLGDLGANGMGIPIGKLSLYTALAGIPPERTLPIMLDVGTNNESLREDPLYLGLNQQRVRGKAYLELVDELVEALNTEFPGCLLQFEDFATPNAYALLGRFQEKTLCFNDDIQGTAAVALAGVYASSRITGKQFSELRVLFLGAGSAATGIGDLFTEAFKAEGLSDNEARQRLWFADQGGLIVAARREELLPHNLPYAHDHPRLSFIDAIHTLKPHILIGATGAPGTFTEEVIGAMSEHNERPVIFALSNPTARAECTAEQAYAWSNGRAVFASGSPFAPVQYEGKELRPGQGNNAYIFPGIGLGGVMANGAWLPSSVFLRSATVLAEYVSESDLSHGTLYPPLEDIRSVSLDIAVAVVEELTKLGLAKAPPVDDLRGTIARSMYDPSY